MESKEPLITHTTMIDLSGTKGLHVHDMSRSRAHAPRCKVDRS